MLTESIDRVEAFRYALPVHGIIDVHYADLVSDLLRTVETIYSACDRELDDQARDAVMACIAANPKGQFGTARIPTGGFRAGGRATCVIDSRHMLSGTTFRWKRAPCDLNTVCTQRRSHLATMRCMASGYGNVVKRASRLTESRRPRGQFTDGPWPSRMEVPLAAILGQHVIDVDFDPADHRPGIGRSGNDALV